MDTPRSLTTSRGATPSDTIFFADLILLSVIWRFRPPTRPSFLATGGENHSLPIFNGAFGEQMFLHQSALHPTPTNPQNEGLIAQSAGEVASPFQLPSDSS